ncbi:hypothetical protein [Borreliella mayonii]|nr:hypothetical protein [Borreliella mayonii]
MIVLNKLKDFANLPEQHACSKSRIENDSELWKLVQIQEFLKKYEY